MEGNGAIADRQKWGIGDSRTLAEAEGIAFPVLT